MSDLKQAIQREYLKCASDPVHFMRKYCTIQHPTKGKVKFDLYPYQERCLTEFKDNRYNIILKARQLGISTLSAGYSLWLMLFHNDKNVLVIATGKDTAKNLVTKVRVMYDGLPQWLKTNTEEINKLSIRFKNGSQIKAISSKGDAGRSEALSLLVLDEAAFIDRIDEIWTAAQQTLATGGGAIMLSTPNGTGNLFHKTWCDAEAGGRFTPIKLHWTVHPERDESWRTMQTELLGEKSAAQECDCDFISSGHTVVDGTLLQWFKETYQQEPSERRGMGGDYWLWEYPDYSKSYMVVADVARGDSSDYSTFHVMETETVQQVAEFRGQPTTKEFGNMLVNVATEWNNALLVIENANVGWAALQVAIDREYRNLYYTYRNDGVTDFDVAMSKGYDLKDKSQMVPGFTTSSRTRPLLISKLDIYFREKECTVRSKRLLDELFVFIWNGSKAEAQQGYNDDLVMAFAIALYVRDTALKMRQHGLDLNRAALSSLGNTQQKSVYTKTDHHVPGTWDMDIGGQNEDLTWLLK